MTVGRWLSGRGWWRWRCWTRERGPPRVAMRWVGSLMGPAGVICPGLAKLPRTTGVTMTRGKFARGLNFTDFYSWRTSVWWPAPYHTWRTCKVQSKEILIAWLRRGGAASLLEVMSCHQEPCLRVVLAHSRLLLIILFFFIEISLCSSFHPFICFSKYFDTRINR